MENLDKKLFHISIRVINTNFSIIYLYHTRIISYYYYAYIKQFFSNTENF